MNRCAHGCKKNPISILFTQLVNISLCYLTPENFWPFTGMKIFRFSADSSFFFFFSAIIYALLFIFSPNLTNFTLFFSLFLFFVFCFFVFLIQLFCNCFIFMPASNMFSDWLILMKCLFVQPIMIRFSQDTMFLTSSLIGSINEVDQLADGLYRVNQL